MRIRRRDCRAYCAGTLRVPRRAGYARGRARLPGCLCARARGEDSAKYLGRPRCDSQTCCLLTTEMRRVSAVVVLAFAVLHTNADARLEGEVRWAVGGLPAPIVGAFAEPPSVQQPPGGPFYVFDRRGHTVYAVDSDTKTLIKLVEIGPELGRILQPRGFDTSATGSFVVADAPRGVERIQIFGGGGLRRGGFTLPARQRTASIVVGPLLMSGIASIRFTEPTLLISQPEGGTLFTEYSSSGYAFRTFGRLRDTGHEQDRDVHLALNVGLPLVDPTGGYFYVFLAGRPMFQKYDRNGLLLFERHIEGPEVDRYLEGLLSWWLNWMVDDGVLVSVSVAVTG